ncbi:MAG: SPFH/Band 7/PHB domain protein, partial [Clostridiales bacterium]|nr:SPFH/Band 7/PHB domain protein [Clostridiales bacterium]
MNFFLNLIPILLLEVNPFVAIGILAPILIAILLIVINVRIVPQSKAYVLERFGAYMSTWQTGIHFKIPFVDRVAKIVSLKEQVVDFPPQPVITKDNVTMQIDTVVFFQITDPKLFAYGVEYPISAIENLTATTLRNIIGDMELDHTLTSRDVINVKIRAILDEATDPWGIKVNRVELKNILPPREIQDAMEKQMKAERERREAILRAEGDKASNVLAAEGKKEAQILTTEADKTATILWAESVKDAKIREAEGEAEAILSIMKAQSEGIDYINKAKPSDGYLSMKGLEAFAKAADGKATKIIIPSEIQSLAGLAAGIKEIASSEKE